MRIRIRARRRIPTTIEPRIIASFFPVEILKESLIEI